MRAGPRSRPRSGCARASARRVGWAPAVEQHDDDHDEHDQREHADRDRQVDREQVVVLGAGADQSDDHDADSSTGAVAGDPVAAIDLADLGRAARGAPALAALDRRALRADHVLGVGGRLEARLVRCSSARAARRRTAARRRRPRLGATRAPRAPSSAAPATMHARLTLPEASARRPAGRARRASPSRCCISSLEATSTTRAGERQPPRGRGVLRVACDRRRGAGAERRAGPEHERQQPRASCHTGTAVLAISAAV